MASSGKQKTTWSKIQRESALRERRLDKAARKAARKLAPPETSPTDVLGETDDISVEESAVDTDLDAREDLAPEHAAD
jgi:hypothetical protein